MPTKGNALIDATTGNVIDGYAVSAFEFSSPTGSSGTFYAAGYYDAPAADANLTQASATQTYGTANASYAAHVFAVAGGAGTVSSGQVGLRVTGTRIQDDGTRTTSYQDVLTTDITTLSTNQYLEGEKFIGQVTYELYVVSGSPATYSLDFNYGFAKYDDTANTSFTLVDFEAVGRAGGNDTGFNVGLIHHKATGWTYSAAAFSPGPGFLVDMNSDHVTETDLVNGMNFAYKRTGLSTSVAGNDSEGFIIQIVTGANNAVETMDVHVGHTQNES